MHWMHIHILSFVPLFEMKFALIKADFVIDFTSYYAVLLTSGFYFFLSFKNEYKLYKPGFKIF